MADLSLSLSSTLMEDGNYFIYYNGDDLDLPCGIYYLTIDIGGEIWYSDLFHVMEISDSLIPEIKFKEFHLALPIYDNILKQSRFNSDPLCDIYLSNPLTRITPFFSTIVTPVNAIEVYLVNAITSTELDITSQLHLICNEGLNYMYYSGGIIEPILCGIYYLHFHTISGDWYSECFKAINLENLEFGNYLYSEDGQLILTEDGQPIIIQEGGDESIILSDSLNHWTNGMPDGWGFAPGSGASILNDDDRVKIGISKDNGYITRFYTILATIPGYNYQIEFDIVDVSVEIGVGASLFCSVDFGGTMGPQYIIETGDNPEDVIKHYVLNDYVNTIGSSMLSFSILNEIPGQWTTDPYLIIDNITIKQI